MPPLSWVRQLPSWAVFTSWQCLCSNWMLSHWSLPPNESGLMWSTSHVSFSLNVSPHSVHLPFCRLSSKATRLFSSGFLPNLVLQYVRLPSYGLTVPFTLTCLIISTLACFISLESLCLYSHVPLSTDQYLLAIQCLDLLGCRLFAQSQSVSHK